jgi:hypothetical protein
MAPQRRPEKNENNQEEAKNAKKEQKKSSCSSFLPGYFLMINMEEGAITY